LFRLSFARLQPEITFHEHHPNQLMIMIGLLWNRVMPAASGGARGHQRASGGETGDRQDISQRLHLGGVQAAFEPTDGERRRQIKQPERSRRDGFR
jgi:hypothetical protein